ncbi:AAA family ATPase [Rhizobium sp. CSW-27]|uniref:AAA family ATPase n=1 Tax=Rhizobium sp. CSW-27 TaxID=2839985 RepID=UPI001C02A8D9|nr:AAA family ATPase [Rhizobium sp. CSW-27]MBT9369462.1 AAA family ATPase [Rhizobium sp. CSW-27]
MNRFVILSGCSGGGKSTLLAELSRLGHAIIEEPGRRIVAEEQASGGSALPWLDMPAFARWAIDMALSDRKRARHAEGWVFFDRSLIDAAAALAHASGEETVLDLCRQHPYHETVFLTPPWPELYAPDAERRHGLEAAIAEYQRLAALFPRLGYQTVLLPKVSVKERAAMILARLGRAP